MNETKNTSSACQMSETADAPQKFCKHCGQRIAEAAVICPFCGCQVEELKGAASPNITIQNSNTQSQFGPYPFAVLKSKWVALLLCLFLGWLGAHRFYEGKVGTGILYLFTAGLFGIGWLVDFIILLFKPNPYYVYL